MDESEAHPIINVTYYTDPLCPWSWGFEPQWRRLRYEFRGVVRWRYRMCGMLSNWTSYSDPVHGIWKPSDVPALWRRVAEESGQRIDESIWLEDPPESSYPPSVAVKAAEFQGDEAGERYLRRLREAVMLERRNVARPEVLLDLAEEVERASEAEGRPPFDRARFERDLKGEEALAEFRLDMKKARARRICSFPTLVLQPPGSPGVMMVGTRPYHSLRSLLLSFAPSLEGEAEALDADEYGAFWEGLTERELAEIPGGSTLREVWNQAIANARVVNG